MTTVRLSQIRAGFEKAKGLGAEHDTFDVDGVTITIRTIVRPESEAVQAKAMKWISEGSRDILPYLNTQKYETLARSIVRIGDLDLTGCEFVEIDERDRETGEVTTRKTERHALIAEILDTWSEPAVDVCWRKYEDLVFKAKQKVRDGVEFVDKHAELEKLEARVAELKDDLGIEEDAEAVEGEVDEDELSEDDVRRAVFTTVDDPDAEDVRVAPPPPSGPEEGDQPSVQFPEAQRREGQEALDEGEMAWELDDAAAAEHERLMRQRQNVRGADEADRRAEEARALRRKRRPMNQTAPTMHTGDMPGPSGGERATTVAYKADEEPPDDYVDAAPVHLGGEARRGD